MFDRDKLLKQAKEQFAADADVLDAVEYILTEYQSPYWTVLYEKHYGLHTLQEMVIQEVVQLPTQEEYAYDLLGGLQLMIQKMPKDLTFKFTTPKIDNGDYVVFKFRTYSFQNI